MSDITLLRQVIDEHFPGLWPAVDLGLAACATLRLADNSNPTALIYVGPASSSKTTVAEMFADHPISYLSDNFTPASFVSHAANVRRPALDNVDLLPRIKHKVLVTPELAPIFRGKEDELAQRFSIITRVLDGQGLMTDSGTHGRRGHRGDYLFVWIGCTTPFEEKVWQVMAQLGSRLFFLLMRVEEQVTVEQLVASSTGLPYKDRLQRCKKAVHAVLTDLFPAVSPIQKPAIRSVPWDASQDPPQVTEWLARFALLLAAMRGGRYREHPYRSHAILSNLARGHAIIHGRRQLTQDDLPPIAQVTVSSMPSESGRVLKALIQEGKPLSVAEVQVVLGLRHHDTAKRVMEELGQGVVLEYVEKDERGIAVLRFRSEWDWCASKEFRDLLLG